METQGCRRLTNVLRTVMEHQKKGIGRRVEKDCR